MITGKKTAESFQHLCLGVTWLEAPTLLGDLHEHTPLKVRVKHPGDARLKLRGTEVRPCVPSEVSAMLVYVGVLSIHLHSSTCPEHPNHLLRTEEAVGALGNSRQKTTTFDHLQQPATVFSSSSTATGNGIQHGQHSQHAPAKPRKAMRTIMVRLLLLCVSTITLNEKA